eukprot:1161606-Pelagomonas_calceolata.AAC.13
MAVWRSNVAISMNTSTDSAMAIPKCFLKGTIHIWIEAYSCKNPKMHARPHTCIHKGPKGHVLCIHKGHQGHTHASTKAKKATSYAFTKATKATHMHPQRPHARPHTSIHKRHEGHITYIHKDQMQGLTHAFTNARRHIATQTHTHTHTHHAATLAHSQLSLPEDTSAPRWPRSLLPCAAVPAVAAAAPAGMSALSSHSLQAAAAAALQHSAISTCNLLEHASTQ